MLSAKSELQNLADMLPAESYADNTAIARVISRCTEAEAAAILLLIERCEEQTCQERGE